MAITALAAWARTWQLASQVVLDDEWHALVKLQSSTYGEILSSFGYADHSIPLTLLYKAMAGTIGLDELDLRALQVACGTALVPFAAWLSWRATRDAPLAALYALTVALSPLLVLYSRIARPYAVTTLLVTACLAALWRWRADPRASFATAAIVLASLATWLHPLTALYPVTAMLCLGIDALLQPPPARSAGVRRVLFLGALMALAMLLPELPPVLADLRSLSAKAGGVHAGLPTVARMLSLFAGATSSWTAVIVILLALLGAALTLRRDRPLGLYLACLAVVPPLVIAIVGAQWSAQGHTFARYVFPLQLIVLFWSCVGAIAIVRRLAANRGEAPAWAACLVLGALFAAVVPTIPQVSRLGAWYGHIYHQLDYDPRFNRARTAFHQLPIPAFFQELGRLPPRSVMVIEAPFSFEAPANPFAYYDAVGRQRAKAGLLGGLCRAGMHEVPPGDPRFRFHSFVFLADPVATRASGARYLVLHREQVDAHPFSDNVTCIEALTRLYGPPAQLDARLAVWDLSASSPRIIGTSASAARQCSPQMMRGMSQGESPG